ncbi:hydrogenase expression/formation protein HypE [Planctomycetales bacterium ZRK34]|nr:hydrogenase expression/formation protein HypE [Planctomycetales bacterium ZRK34]
MIRDDHQAGPTLTSPRSNGARISLAHGGGGQLTDELIGGLVLPRLGNGLLNELLDSAVLPLDAQHRLALTIDAYVVTPWRFAGGDIGRLAVSGTVNDLSVAGAKPLGLALSMILAEGLPQRDLDVVLASVAQASSEAGVPVVTGDTKVVGHGQADGIYLITAGVGVVPTDRRLHPDSIKAGDALIINGPIGEHGLTVMLAREMPEIDSVLRSDVAPLNHLINRVMTRHGGGVHFMRDATRSGLAGLAADLAKQSGRHITLDEAVIPVRPEARHAADMLGLDPLEVANEGKVVIVADRNQADQIVATMREHELGKQACVIGWVGDDGDGICELNTLIGGRRIIQKPYGEQLPRIC